MVGVLCPCFLSAEIIKRSSEVSWRYLIMDSLFCQDEGTLEYSSSPRLKGEIWLHLLCESAAPNNSSMDSPVNRRVLLSDHIHP